MARKIEAGEYRRGELFFIPPDEIVVDPKQNGRAFPELEQNAVDDLIEVLESGGQLEPVKVRMITDKRVQLVFGYRRVAAYKKVNAGRPAELRLLVPCVVADQNEEEAFLDNVAENVRRKSLSDVDVAFIVRRLREQYGKSEEECAQVFRKSVAWVQRHLKILQLDREILMKIHTGVVPMESAIVLTKVEPEKRGEVLKAAESEAKEAKASKAEKAPRTDEPEEAPKPVKVKTPAVVREARKAGMRERIGRTLKEIKEIHIGLTGPGEPKPIREFAESFLNFAEGWIEEEEYIEAIEKLVRERRAK